jgi:SAM-dependent methyltransferase
MPAKIADRFVWAVEMLELSPSDRLLEIGCGSGVAVSLICDRLSSGRIVAIDRSPAMIRLASKRNRAHLALGKAAFHAAALDEVNNQPPTAAKAPVLAERMAGGFSIQRVTLEPMRPAPTACVVGRAPSAGAS